MLKEKWRGLSGNVKRVILGIGALFFLILIIGAGIYLDVPRRIRLWHPTEQVIREDVIQYLKERYGEEFVITNVLPPGYNYASYIITAYPSGASQDYEHEITIQGWEKRGLITYYDNYSLVKLIPQFKEYVSDVVSEFFPENKVYIHFYNEWYDENPDYNNIKSFLDEKNGNWHNTLNWAICIPKNELANIEILNKANGAVNKMAQEGISGMGFINIMNNDNYEKLPQYGIRDMLGKNGKDFVDLSYYISNSGKFVEQKEVK